MIKVAIEAARMAGNVIKKNIKYQKNFSYKNDKSIITKTDLASEKIIIDSIKKNFPRHSFLSEEAGVLDKNSSDFVWIIDPLDGTTNFSRHIPYVCVAIALTHKNKLELGVVYDPLHNELFWAQKNKGAYVNDKKISKIVKESPEQHTVGFSRGAGPEAKKQFVDICDKIIPAVRSVRSFGATNLSLCHTADNRFDTYFSGNGYFHDHAAGGFIAQEAGASVTDFQGKTWKPKIGQTTDMLVTDKKYMAEFCALLKK